MRKMFAYEKQQSCGFRLRNLKLSKWAYEDDIPMMLPFKIAKGKIHIFIEWIHQNSNPLIFLGQNMFRDCCGVLELKKKKQPWIAFMTKINNSFNNKDRIEFYA